MKFKRVLTCLILLSMMCFSVVGGVYVANTFAEKLNPSLTDDGVEIDGDFLFGNKVNILVVGTDKSSNLTDTIILFQIDTTSKTIKSLSIPRDTRIVLGKSHRRINEAYAYSGKKEQTLLDSVRGITGLPIHYYVTVGLEGFRSIIDYLGGIDINVEKRMYYNDPTQKLSIAIDAGFQHMDGKTAEGYVRFRHNYAEGDIGRIKLQQSTFIKEFIKQKLTLSNIHNANEIFGKLKEFINTNFSITEIVNLVNKMKNIDTSNIETFILPGEPRTIGDASYWIVHPNETTELINKEFK